MSNKAIDWALSIKLDDPRAKLILLVLANRAHPRDGKCWPSRKEISEQSDQSIRSVQRHLNEFEAAGLIGRKRRQRASTIYQLLMPEFKTGQGKLRSATAGTSRKFRSAKTEFRSATVGTQKPNLEPKLRTHTPVAAATDEIEVEFEKFWQIKPSRGTASNPKRRALKAYRAAVKDGNDPAAINDRAKQWAIEEAKRSERERHYVPMAATWLNDRHFEETKTSTEAVPTFPDYVDSERGRAFMAHYAKIGNKFMLSQLKTRELEGRKYPFASEWPPDYQLPKIAVVK